MAGVLLTLICGLLIGWWIGWTQAHHTVAKECERLGSFYVGNKTFTCTQIDRKEHS